MMANDWNVNLGTSKLKLNVIVNFFVRSVVGGSRIDQVFMVERLSGSPGLRNTIILAVKQAPIQTTASEVCRRQSIRLVSFTHSP